MTTRKDDNGIFELPENYTLLDNGLWVMDDGAVPDGKLPASFDDALKGLREILPKRKIVGMTYKESFAQLVLAYSVGGTMKDRRIADSVFLHNLYVEIWNSNGLYCVKFFRLFVARRMFRVLRRHGVDCFSHSRKMFWTNDVMATMKTVDFEVPEFSFPYSKRHAN